ncbi:MAG: hypothetical protein HPZ00_02190 [Christensenellaceae bacterium]|jgi:hypothetical protein|nr:hypothetical protein [Christensenellaceae bacterium]MBS6563790.1 hypothetical protein [Clostridiales bacterium]PWL96856.1 MAG: hypothetical protein DBY09_07055 [Selenomonadales bacterium]
MPWGISIIAAMAVLLLFGVGEKTAKRLSLNKTLAILLLLVTAAGLLIPDIRIGSALVINLGGFLFPLIVAVYIFAKARPGQIGHGLICALAVAAVMLAASYFISPVPEGIIAEPGLLYGVIAGLTAFIAGFNSVSALGGLLSGLVLWDVALGLLYRYYYALNVPVELGMYSFGDTLALAFIICAFLTSLTAERESRKASQNKRIKMYKKYSLFEIGDIEQEERRDDEHSEKISGDDWPEDEEKHN